MPPEPCHPFNPRQSVGALVILGPCRYVAMGRIIQKFKLGRDESKDPFEKHDTTAQSLMFIYLTGRGEYSYLFEAASVNEVIEEAGATIPMGYTQLWIIQWLKSVHPMSGDRKVRRARRLAAEAGARDRGTVLSGHRQRWTVLGMVGESRAGGERGAEDLE